MIDEARKHLEASYGQSSAYQINSHLGYLEVIFLKAANAKAHIKVTIGEGRIVDGIIFGFFEDQPTTAEIYTLLGPPTLFSRADSGSTNPGYALVYGSQKWRVTFNGWLASDLSCKDEIDVVTFSTYGLTNEVLSDADNSWPGFYKFAKRLGCLPS